MHAPLERQPQVNDNINSPNANYSNQAEAAASKQVIDNLNKLMSSCVVLRIEDFTLYRVTTSGKKQMPKEFISGKRITVICVINIRFRIKISMVLYTHPDPFNPVFY